MSNNRIRWDGLDELRDALRRLPEELRGEGSEIVVTNATGAKTEIVEKYPDRTGNLRGRVTLGLDSGSRFGAGAVVKNTAKHAYIFENGSQARHTALGANRGTMPPGHVFIPTVMRWRRRMYDQLKALLERHGLSVSGDA